MIPLSATAVLDRFLHRAEVIKITGKSYRLSGGDGADEQQKANDQTCKDD